MIVLRFEHETVRWPHKPLPKHEQPEILEWLDINPEVRVIESFDHRYNSIIAFPDEIAATEFRLKFGK